MCEQKPNFYVWRDLSQPGDELHLSDGVPPTRGIFLGPAGPDTLTLLTLPFACAPSGVSLYDTFVVTGVLFKHISTLK